MLTDTRHSDTIHIIISLECEIPIVVDGRGSGKDTNSNIVYFGAVGIFKPRYLELIAKLFDVA